MKPETLSSIGLLAGLISFTSGLLVLLGYTHFLLGVAFVVFAVSPRHGWRSWLGVTLSVLGLLLGIIGILR